MGRSCGEKRIKHCLGGGGGGVTLKNGFYVLQGAQLHLEPFFCRIFRWSSNF